MRVVGEEGVNLEIESGISQNVATREIVLPFNHRFL